MARVLHQMRQTVRSLAFLSGVKALRKAPIVRLTIGTIATSAAFSLPFVALRAREEESSFMAEPITDVDTLERSTEMKHRVELFIMRLQKEIIKSLEELEPTAQFRADRYLRKEGGGGVSCIIEEGGVLEKGGVNVSVVHGHLGPQALRQMNARGKNLPEASDARVPFYATGISCVLHPRNPNVPTVHFNYRYFETTGADGQTSWWFGGGTDLTPYYLEEKDVKHFHQTLKTACDRHDPTYYTEFKKWCDKYFDLTHRGERRGVGGIFFDDLTGPSQEKTFEFVKSCANAVLPSFLPILKNRKDQGYGYKEREWQLLRRGRYVEFNLVHDRGTKFGLHTPGARIESILVSLPATAKWKYCHEPANGSRESELMKILKNPRDWV